MLHCFFFPGWLITRNIHGILSSKVAAHIIEIHMLFMLSFHLQTCIILYFLAQSQVICDLYYVI